MVTRAAAVPADAMAILGGHDGASRHDTTSAAARLGTIDRMSGDDRIRLAVPPRGLRS